MKDFASYFRIAGCRAQRLRASNCTTAHATGLLAFTHFNDALEPVAPTAMNLTFRDRSNANV